MFYRLSVFKHFLCSKQSRFQARMDLNAGFTKALRKWKDRTKKAALIINIRGGKYCV
jgi:hypothetical protein